MTWPTCPRCASLGWVCETHDDQPWAELTGINPCCGAPGKPCPDCTRTDTRIGTRIGAP